MRGGARGAHGLRRVLISAGARAYERGGSSAGGGAVDAVFPGGGAARASCRVFGALMAVLVQGVASAAAGRRAASGARILRGASPARGRAAPRSPIIRDDVEVQAVRVGGGHGVRSRMVAVVAAICFVLGQPSTNRRQARRWASGCLGLPETIF